jgi:putative oxidoreductase
LAVSTLLRRFYPAGPGWVLQRLFSTFANGWPGIGLLLQRLLIAAALAHFGTSQVNATSEVASIVPSVIGVAAAILLLIGLWTPVAGSLIAIVQMWSVFSHAGDRWTSIMLATLAATLAMIGPGAWSIDARLFGREHIEIAGH